MNLMGFNNLMLAAFGESRIVFRIDRYQMNNMIFQSMNWSYFIQNLYTLPSDFNRMHQFSIQSLAYFEYTKIQSDLI